MHASTSSQRQPLVDAVIDVRSTARRSTRRSLARANTLPDTIEEDDVDMEKEAPPADKLNGVSPFARPGVALLREVSAKSPKRTPQTLLMTRTLLKQQQSKSFDSLPTVHLASIPEAATPTTPTTRTTSISFDAEQWVREAKEKTYDT